MRGQIMLKDFSRIDRIASVIHHELARLIELELQFSGFGLITITDVKVSTDLSYAKIYVVTHDEKKTELVLQRLNEMARSLRFQLGKIIRIKKIPQLHFYHDKSIAEGDHISKLLNKLEE